jgi:putative serine protease PepD
MDTERHGEPNNTKSRATRWAAIGALGIVIAAGAGVAGGVAAADHGTAATDGDTSSTALAAAVASAKNGTVTVADLVAAVTPSVVTVAAPVNGGTAEGSGVVVRADGWIVTNDHVVSGAAGTIRVTFADGRVAPATVVTTDRTNDLALLKVSGVTGLTPLSLGDSTALQVGDEVFAIGNPLGLGTSVSEGIVSALNRSLTESRGQAGQSGLIQTDAAVNEGNSGGALIDDAGQLMGITNAIATSGTSSGNLGVAFAIPSAQVRAFLDRAAA